MGEGGVKAAALAEHLFAQLGPDEGTVRGVMSEGGVRTFLTLGPAGLGFEVESAPVRVFTSEDEPVLCARPGCGHWRKEHANKGHGGDHDECHGGEEWPEDAAPCDCPAFVWPTEEQNAAILIRRSADWSARQAVLESAAVVGVDPASGPDRAGVVIIHHPSKGGPLSNLRKLMAEAYQPLLDEAAALFIPGLPAPRLTFEGNGSGWCGSSPVGSECGFLAGDPCAGAVYPSGGLGKRGPKRPGQWGWRARMLRARRLEKARARADHEWTRRAWGRQQAVLGGRRGERALDAWIGRR